MGFTACAGGSRSTHTPEDAKVEALQLLRKTEKAVDVSWPDTPEPTAEPCDDGVRFAYFVPVSVDNDAKATAESLRQFWESEGLRVSPSETDFGTRGTLYSATADRDGAGGAAYQISSTSVAVQVTSPCATGSVHDQDE
ncbi:hypothetical protein [Curtobacterium sp. BRB10]|uniref:hypothetical protein n=1 Tax=Curtobacterium sp. BRB10 TaxID=2962579 RepID=UPI0028818CF1|nr:hypothetical protein [Curtobacterium sp. BRB10]MDT0234437.1 hypothetical protein [Curtobacterium sp. BRB10]